MDHERRDNIDGMSDQNCHPIDRAGINPPSTAVGYKRPPVTSRFKKGRSGNNKGRPIGRRNFRTIFDEVLGQTISVRDGGQPRRISKAEAIAKIALNGAIKGDARALNAFLLLSEHAGMLTPPLEGPAARFGYLIIPGVATPEEWNKEALEALERQRVLTESQHRKSIRSKDPITGKIIVRRPVD